MPSSSAGSAGGGRRTDDGWPVFQTELKSCPLPPRVIAERLRPHFAIDTETVSHWRQGKKRPQFAQLPMISAVIAPMSDQGDPTYLARKMGMVPDRHELGREVFRLTERVAELKSTERKLDRQVTEDREAAIGKIVQWAQHSGRWGVAVWPALEGTREIGPSGQVLDYRFHVADRLDFRLVDGPDCPTALDALQLLRQEGTLMELLDGAHAVESYASPRWSSSFMTRPIAQSSPIPVATYSVPRLSANFTYGTVEIKEQDVRAIMVVALTVSSWAADTSGFLARMLNYGMISSRAMCTEVYRKRGHANEAPARLDEIDQLRAGLHKTYLSRPRDRHVWSHFSLADDPSTFFPAATEDWPSKLSCIWLRETDALLSNRGQRPQFLEKARRARDELDELVREINVRRPGSIVPIDIDYPDYPDREVRDRRIEQALRAAADAVDALVRLGQISPETISLTQSELTGDGRTEIARKTYAWLRDHGRLFKTV